ncbi:MAG: RNA polymerase sigma factor [Planctomycetota bacterium]|jgi:RNA polymerase sigma-70 factor (ECF subfamily)
MTSAHRANPAVAAREEKTATSGDTPAAAAMSGMAGDDAEDLAAARAGDQTAFARIYDRHAAVVLSLCRRFSLAEAEDATQETFIRAHQLLAKVEHPDKLRPWLYSIARRVCSERTRSARRRARHEEQFAVSRTVHPTGAAPAAPEATARAEQLRRLDAALERLDERHRLAIHLYYLEADPVRAAASALGLSRSGYYKLLAKARQQLAGLMK